MCSLHAGKEARIAATDWDGLDLMLGEHFEMLQSHGKSIFISVRVMGCPPVEEEKEEEEEEDEKDE